MPVAVIIVIGYLVIGAFSALHMVVQEIKHRKTSLNTFGEIAWLAWLITIGWSGWVYGLAVDELRNDFNHDSK